MCVEGGGANDPQHYENSRLSSRLYLWWFKGSVLTGPRKVRKQIKHKKQDLASGERKIRNSIRHSQKMRFGEKRFGEEMFDSKQDF